MHQKNIYEIFEFSNDINEIAHNILKRLFCLWNVCCLTTNTFVTSSVAISYQIQLFYIYKISKCSDKCDQL